MINQLINCIFEKKSFCFRVKLKKKSKIRNKCTIVRKKLSCDVIWENPSGVALVAYVFSKV